MCLDQWRIAFAQCESVLRVQHGEQLGPSPYAARSAAGFLEVQRLGCFLQIIFRQQRRVGLRADGLSLAAVVPPAAFWAAEFCEGALHMGEYTARFFGL